jgi:tol-pal system protein YbgF
MRYWSLRAAFVLVIAAAAIGSTAAAQEDAAAKAQSDRIEKRFKALEHQVHQLQSILTQARDTGQPISVRVTTDPDPALDGLQTRLDDLEQSARTRNDQIDTLTHDLEIAKKDAADARAQLKALAERLDRVEARLLALQSAAAQAADSQGATGPVAAPPQAGGAPSAPPTPPDSASAFKAAKQLLLDGEYARASAAFQAFVDTYGDAPNAPEAHYWLGETLFIRGAYADAAAAYIGAIRGWPQTSWAPDAVVKLARSLVALNKPQDACRTLDEFDRRYPSAPPPVRAKAQAARSQAMCG